MPDPLIFRAPRALTNRRGNFSLEGVHGAKAISYQAVLFDLDGTLIDHFRIIYRCYQYALARLQLEPVGYDKLKASVGGSIVITMGKLIPQEQVPKAVELFREEFDRIWHEEITILPGAGWLLEGLHARGTRLCVFTNKEGNRARRILAHIGLDRHLDGIFGSLDTPWIKPQPEFTRHVLEQLGADPAHACMVGDSPYDVEAAAVAGMACFTVATGSHTLTELREQTRAAGVYANLFELGEAVFGLPQPLARGA